MITIKCKGNFKHFDRFCARALKREYLEKIAGCCEKGVIALKNATPTDSGKTAAAWSYEIENKKDITKVWFTNSHEENGANVAILIIYGHATRNGSYVEGIDFVTPALRPVFEEIADNIWIELIKP